jgi:hypothetical protein
VIKYGLFYIGLKDEKYYWEILVNNAKKVVVVILSVSLNNDEGIWKLLMIIFTFLYVYHLQIKTHQPYIEPYLNEVEL